MKRLGWLVLVVAMAACGSGSDDVAPRGTTNNSTTATTTPTSTRTTTANNTTVGPINNGTNPDGTVTEGQPCSGNCLPPLLCINADGGGGSTCMSPCDTPGGLCQGGEICVGITGGLGNICYSGGPLAQGQACERNTQCARGLKCIGVEGQRFCMQPCTDMMSEVCQGEQYCRIYSGDQGFCRDTLGSFCTTTPECQSAEHQCVLELEQPALWNAYFPNGYCTKPGCMSDADCEGGNACRPFFDQGNHCLDACQGDADCRFFEGYSCQDASACEAILGAEERTACQALFVDETRLCLRANFVGAGQ